MICFGSLLLCSLTHSSSLLLVERLFYPCTCLQNCFIGRFGCYYVHANQCNSLQTFHVQFTSVQITLVQFISSLFRVDFVALSTLFAPFCSHTVSSRACVYVYKSSVTGLKLFNIRMDLQHDPCNEGGAGKRFKFIFIYNNSCVSFGLVWFGCFVSFFSLILSRTLFPLFYVTTLVYIAIYLYVFRERNYHYHMVEPQ